jgi:hypothetical protein
MDKVQKHNSFNADWFVYHIKFHTEMGRIEDRGLISLG